MAQSKKQIFKSEYKRQTWSGEDYIVDSVPLLAKVQGHNNQSRVISDLVLKEIKRVGLKKLSKVAAEDGTMDMYKDFLNEVKRKKTKCKSRKK